MEKVALTYRNILFDRSCEGGAYVRGELPMDFFFTNRIDAYPNCEIVIMDINGVDTVVHYRDFVKNSRSFSLGFIKRVFQYETVVLNNIWGKE